jgi:hypothetical protein
MKSHDEQQKQIAEAIALFPATFQLRAFPNETFRISQRDSYVNDSDALMLYTERLCEDGKWKSFAKGTVGELRTEIVSSLPARILTNAQLSNARANQMQMARQSVPLNERGEAVLPAQRQTAGESASRIANGWSTVTIDAEVWKSVRFFIEGLAIMGTVKHDHPELHRNVVKLARAIELAVPSEPSACIAGAPTVGDTGRCDDPKCICNSGTQSQKETYPDIEDPKGRRDDDVSMADDIDAIDAAESAAFVDPHTVRDYGSMTVKALQQLAKNRGMGLMNLRHYKRRELTAELEANDRGRKARPIYGEPNTGGGK